MKKLVYALVALATLTLASCEKEPIGGTETEQVAGQWYVECLGIDNDGTILFEDADLFGIGKFWVITFNTASNDVDSIFVQDVFGALWDFKVKVAVDQSDHTFGITSGDNLQYPCKADITNGKILFDAAKTPSGQPADSIVFDILFDDDSYAGVYYDRLRITGIRYTGLAADD